MTDRELLEAAAKAAGIEVWFPRLNGGKNPDGTRIILTPCYTEIDRVTVEWDPLTDDGDALRLAVKLRMDIAHFHDFARANIAIYDDCHENNGDDPCAATRRAIVRAAAEMGKTK